ncbi:von Willebrand factor A domain-containing protein 5A-like [Saccostrea cucullata]|uniref:von Willebrand factor A domain-containing protein 5A-like n=1 Tax=Saccostrea cuccullata TaxID=36930 RepID=UPI002ED2C7C5
MFGLVSFKENHGYRNSSRSVPLKAIDIQVSIHGFIANVQSVLHYFNDGDNNTETEFVFPLNTDSAVYKFEAEIDGRTIVADVCDKSQAIMIYKDAVSSGHTAMYMAEDDEAGDVFRLRLGNLPAKAAAKLTFAYVQELELNADQTGTFTLPSVLNPRYIPDCTPAEGSNGEESQEEDQETTIFQSDVDVAYFSDFSITLNAEIAGGENMKVFENKLEFDVFSGAMEKAMTSTKQLKHGSDFLLLLYYKGFNSPRAIIEKGNKDEQNAFMSSDVMMVNFSPEFKDIETEIPCEFVFIIDRSGSMHGDRINKAKEALLLLLKSLPVDCLFNVVSFGSVFSFLFPKSQQYNEENLEEALNLQKKMDADMGGTEIYKPLEEVFRTKPINSYARQIFLLTDGEVSNVSKIVDLVRRQKNTRVFTFGIGYGCSSDLVTKVARASQGKATFVRDNERLQSKIMSALKCSLQSALTDVSLSWSLPKCCTVINSPEEVSGVFQGEKLILYAIISGEIPEDYSCGTSLKMVGKAGKKSVEFSVDFDLSKSRDTTDNSYPLHRLAAKTKLSEMEINRSDKGIMVALSTALNVTCKYTAFVGVDKTKRETQSRGQDKDSSCKTEVSESLDDDSSLKLSDLDLSMTKSSSLPGLGRRFANFCASLLPSRSKKTKTRKSSHTRSKERKFYCISGRPYEMKCAGFIDGRSTLSAGPQSSYVSSCMNSGSISNNLHGDLSMRAAQVDATMCSGSFSDDFQDESEEDCASLSDLRRDLDLRKDEAPSRMIQLIERQKFNGSWSLDDCLSQILNKPLDEMKNSSVIKDTDVWATALAIAFLRKEFSAQKNEWEMIEQKAMKWLKTKDMEGKDIVQEAVTFLSA